MLYSTHLVPTVYTTLRGFASPASPPDGLVAGEVHQLLGLGAPLHGQDAIVDDGLPQLEEDGNPGLDVVHVGHIS